MLNSDDMLNADYYNNLRKKYGIEDSAIDELTSEMVFSNRSKDALQFSFPKDHDLTRIIGLLYQHFSIDIFIHDAEITDYQIGDKLKRNGEKSKNIYTVTKIDGQNYRLKKHNDETNLEVSHTFDQLKRKYTQVKQNARNSTLSKYTNYFHDINCYGFLPTHFSKKIVLIAGQTMWNNLINKDCIPTIYLPNIREGEQTQKRSIEALDDCIAYVTPKYEVCYEEILRKDVKVDTILVCDTDLKAISQIVQDRSQYNFNLIILSSGEDISINKEITAWNWCKEEVDLLEKEENRNIAIECIDDVKLSALIQHFEDCVEYVSSLGIPLKSYGYFLRLALNVLQEEQFNNLLMRLDRNKDLEKNDGGYEDFADKNPKHALRDIICYLQQHNGKRDKLNQLISSTTRNTLIVADREDIDSLRELKNHKCKIISNAELKRLLHNKERQNHLVVLYSFNGRKDFDFVYYLPNDVQMVLYEQEKNLYARQLQNHRKELEEELISYNRFSICNIKYEPIIESKIKVSPTLEQIIERLDRGSKAAYDSYKDESDSLLDNLEEDITYRIIFNDNSSVELGSNETAFNEKGDLIKSYRLNIGHKIRIYPRNLADNLIEVAISEEPEIFGKIEEHSDLWQNALKSLDMKYNDRAKMYDLLRNNGLKVLSSTVDSYFRGNRKFPMFNSDLKAILTLSDNLPVLNELVKYKRLYNSTTIALGRGVKQELKQFLQENTLGDILSKKNFTKETLHKFIEDKMPLLTITKIEEVNDEQ
jgi:hypothetical protein